MASKVITKYPTKIEQAEAVPQTTLVSEKPIHRWHKVSDYTSGGSLQCGYECIKKIKFGTNDYRNVCPISAKSGTYDNPSFLRFIWDFSSIPNGSTITKVVFEFKHVRFGISASSGNKLSGSQNAPSISGPTIVTNGGHSITSSAPPVDSSTSKSHTFTGKFTLAEARALKIRIDYPKNANGNPGAVAIGGIKATVYYDEPAPPACNINSVTNNEGVLTTSANPNCQTELRQTVNYSNCSGSVSVTSKPANTTITAVNSNTFAIKDSSEIAGRKAITYKVGDKSTVAYYTAQLPPNPVIKINPTQIVKGQSQPQNFLTITGGCGTITAHIDSINATAINTSNLYTEIQKLSCGVHTVYFKIGTKEVARINIELIPDVPKITLVPNYDEENKYNSNRLNPDKTIQLYANKTVEVTIMDETRNNQQTLTLTTTPQNYNINVGRSGIYSFKINYKDSCLNSRVDSYLFDIVGHTTYYDQLLIKAEDGTSFDYKSLVVWEGDNVDDPIIVDDIVPQVDINDIKIFSRDVHARVLEENTVDIGIKNIGDTPIKNILIELNLFYNDGSNAFVEWTESGIFKNLLKQFYIMNPELEGLVELVNLDNGTIENIYLKISELTENCINIKLPFISNKEKEIYLEFRILGELKTFKNTFTGEQDDEELMILINDPVASTLVIEGEKDYNDADDTGCYKPELNYIFYNDDDGYDLDKANLLIDNDPRLIPIAFIDDNEVEIPIDFTQSDNIEIYDKFEGIKIVSGEESQIFNNTKAVRFIETKTVPLKNYRIELEVMQQNGTVQRVYAKTNEHGIATANITIPDNTGYKYTIDDVENELIVSKVFKETQEYTAYPLIGDPGNKSISNVEIVKNNKKYNPGEVALVDFRLTVELKSFKNYLYIMDAPIEDNKFNTKIKYQTCQKGIYTTTFKTNDIILVDNYITEDIYCGIETEIYGYAQLQKDIVELNDYNQINITVSNKIKKTKDARVTIDLGDKYEFVDMNIDYGDFLSQDNLVFWYIGEIEKNTTIRGSIQIQAKELGDSTINVYAEDYIHTPFFEKDLHSVIINQRKKLYFDVWQSEDFVFPNQEFQYDVYVKNISENLIENVKLKIVDPKEVDIKHEAATEDEYFLIDELKKGLPISLNLPARVSKEGIYYVTFICYGDNTEVYHETLRIECGYIKSKEETEHILTVFNFTPYESHYQLSASDFNDDVTQITKIQNKPYKAKESYHKVNPNLDYHKRVLLNKNMDDLPSIPVPKENFEINIKERFVGENLEILFQKINDKSKLIRGKYLQNGNNEMENALRQLYPDGFINRFGLLSSEIYQFTGVLPTYFNMADYLFRWDPSGLAFKNVYPELKKFPWNSKPWAGEVHNVYEFDGTIRLEVGNFHTRRDAEIFIERQEIYNEAEGRENITYEIQTRYYDAGVFFINIPIYEIPSNFNILDNDELFAIVQRAKPLGMRPLIRYQTKVIFNNSMDIDLKINVKPKIVIDAGDPEPIVYYIQSKKYNSNTNDLELNGLSVYNGVNVEQDIDVRLKNIHRNYKNSTFKCLKDITWVQGKEYNFGEYVAHNNVHYIVVKKHIANTEPQNDRTNYKLVNNYNAENGDNKCHADYNSSNCIDMDIEQDIRGTINKQKVNLTHIDEYAPILYGNFNKDINFNKNANSSPSLAWDNYSFEYSIGDIPEINFNESKKQIINPIDNAINISNPSLKGIETGLYVKSKGKIYILSFVFDNTYNNYTLFNKIIENDSTKEVNKIITDFSQIAIEKCTFNNTELLVAYYRKNDKYYYFDHITVPIIDEIGVFSQNKELRKESKNFNLLVTKTHISKRNITLNTPTYSKSIKDDFKYDEAGTSLSWKNLYRLDPNEKSYSSIQNSFNEERSSNLITIYNEKSNIPKNAIIENIILKINAKSNLDDKIFRAGLELSSNHKKSDENYNMIVTPKNISADNVNLSLDYLDVKNDPLKITHPYWIKLSNIINKNYSNIRDIKLIIEGYNHRTDNQINAQLSSNKIFNEIQIVNIQKGYFYEEISLGKMNNAKDIECNFSFSNKVSDIDIFDTKIEVIFEEVNNESFNSPLKTFSINEKNIYLLDKPIKASELKAGYTVTLDFGRLLPSEYVRLYSAEVDIVYKNTESSFVSNKIEYEALTYDPTVSYNKGDYVRYDDLVYEVTDATEAGVIPPESSSFLKKEFKLTGLANKNVTGNFFDEMTMVSNEDVISYDENHNYIYGIELEKAVYQSFIPTNNFLSSVEFLVNGYKGSPSKNLKLSILEDSNRVPGKVIKEIFVDGWKKSDDSIKYNVFVDDLIPNQTYWIKLEVLNNISGNFYYLRYLDQALDIGRVFYEKNKDLISVNNGSACLGFNAYTSVVNSIFNKIPYNNSLINEGFLSLQLNSKNKTEEISKLRVMENKENFEA